jgi:predicted AAA+ superfamily ATPase
VACAIFALPPFHDGGRREMLRRPRAYGSDTGSVAFVRGWRNIRDDDLGHLREHLVLEILRTGAGTEGLI